MKQVILVRQDLNMPKGKMAAQVAHAAVECTLKADKRVVEEWRQDGMKKSVLKVADLKELKKFANLAKKAKLNYAIIQDAGRTFFKKGTVTCMGIGPARESEIDSVTGELKLI